MTVVETVNERRSSHLLGETAGKNGYRSSHGYLTAVAVVAAVAVMVPVVTAFIATAVAVAIVGRGAVTVVASRCSSVRPLPAVTRENREKTTDSERRDDG